MRSGRQHVERAPLPGSDSTVVAPLDIQQSEPGCAPSTNTDGSGANWLDSQDHRTYSGRSYRFQEQAYNAFDSRSITAEWVGTPSRGPVNPAATRLAGRFSGEAGLFRRCWLLHRPTVKKISLGVDGCDPGFKMSQAPKREKNLTSAGGLASR